RLRGSASRCVRRVPPRPWPTTHPQSLLQLHVRNFPGYPSRSKGIMRSEIPQRERITDCELAVPFGMQEGSRRGEMMRERITADYRGSKPNIVVIRSASKNAGHHDDPAPIFFNPTLDRGNLNCGSRAVGRVCQ